MFANNGYSKEILKLYNEEVSYMSLVELEECSFDSLSINGETIGEKFGDRSWISGRSFGDNRLSRDFFFDNVDKYLVEG